MIEVDIREARWKLDGLCNEYDADLMWPVGTTGPAEAQIQQAKAVCAQCPIAARCLEFANQNHEYYGIWGGLTEEERRELRRVTKTPMLRKAPKKKKPTPYMPDAHSVPRSVLGAASVQSRRHREADYSKVLV